VGGRGPTGPAFWDELRPALCRSKWAEAVVTGAIHREGASPRCAVFVVEHRCAFGRLFLGGADAARTSLPPTGAKRAQSPAAADVRISLPGLGSSDSAPAERSCWTAIPKQALKANLDGGTLFSWWFHVRYNTDFSDEAFGRVALQACRARLFDQPRAAAPLPVSRRIMWGLAIRDSPRLLVP